MAVKEVKAVINGVTHTLTYNATSGKYEKTITAPTITSYNVNAGHYYPVTVIASDYAGNEATKNDADAALGANLKLTVKEKTKPTIAIVSPGASSRLTTSAPTITFQLRDEANGSGIKISSLALKINAGAAIGNTATGMTCTQVTGGYDCTYVVQSALPEGANTITVDIQDNDGNAATQALRSFTVDTIPPTLNVTSPDNDFITNQANITVTGSTNDSTSSPCTVTVKLNGVDQGVVTLDAGGNFSKAITLANGANTIGVRSTDAAGKYSEVTRAVTLDTTPPTISAVTITSNPVDAGATFTITVTVAD